MSSITGYLMISHGGAIDRECLAAAIDAHEEGLMRGLCEQGAREAARRVVEEWERARARDSSGECHRTSA